MLNRIYFNSNEKQVATSYAFKLLAEDFQLMGHSNIALICAGAYSLQIEKYNSYKTNKNISDRNMYTRIQETFVLLHELIHYAFANNLTYNNINEIRTEVIELLEDRASTTDIGLADSYLSDRHKTIYGHDDSYSDYLTQEQISSIESDLKSEHQQHMNELIQIVTNKDSIIEEILCDDMAALLTIAIATKQFKFPLKKTIDALYVGMMNLRILGIINKQAIDFIGNYNTSQSFLKESGLRLIRHRNEASLFFGIFTKNPKNGYKIQNTLTKTNIKYSRIISDPILFMLPESLNRLPKDKFLDIEYDYEENTDINNKIDLILRGN